MSAAQPMPLMTPEEVHRCRPPADEEGFGALSTARGNLPLRALEVKAKVTGLLARITLTQTYVNVFAERLEATYIFPLPDRGALTQLRMEVAGRTIDGLLKERGQARQEYAAAIARGHRAAIAEEERPGVFTLRMGNLDARETARVTLHLTVPLSYEDGEATFRFPLVVAPRYIPGAPLSGELVGDGVASDTDAVPDASRISPPVLLPGFPHPVRLGLEVEVDPAGLELGPLRSSLHAVTETLEGRRRRVSVLPGERLDRDFILRFPVAPEGVSTSLALEEDAEGGTFLLTLVPPAQGGQPQRSRDVVFVLDRSGSMEGWKMVAARRALARMVDTLTSSDRFTVLAFDDQVERPGVLPARGLAPASDRTRFRCVEAMAKVEARGGTELLAPLREAVRELAGAEQGRERILVLVTDGQVGNEDQLLRELAAGFAGLRIFTVGIDTAVNEAFLRRLAALGGGACELLESEDRLDEAMDRIHRRIASPVLTGLALQASGITLEPDTLVPHRLPALFASAPLVVTGRYRGQAPGASITVQAHDALARPWSQRVPATVSDNAAIPVLWARGQVRALEDRYAIGAEDTEALERRIVALSLAHGVLCRFTAFIAVDRGETVKAPGPLHRVTQAVELPHGWSAQGAASAPPPPGMARSAAPAPSSHLRLEALDTQDDEAPDDYAMACAPAEEFEASMDLDSEFAAFDAAEPIPEPEEATRSVRSKGFSAPPRPPPAAPAASYMPARSGGSAGQPVPELDAYRQRARELATALESRPTLTGLMRATVELGTLVEDVSTTAPGHAGLARLEAVLKEARLLLAQAQPDEAGLKALIPRVLEALRAFADPASPTPAETTGRRRSLKFWR